MFRSVRIEDDGLVGILVLTSVIVSSGLGLDISTNVRIFWDREAEVGLSYHNIISCIMA